MSENKNPSCQSENSFNRRAYDVKAYEFPEFCRIIHEQMNSQTAKMEANLLQLENSYHERHLVMERRFNELHEMQILMLREVEIWKSNARIIRWFAVGLGASIIWLFDKWSIISSHFIPTK